MGRKAGATLFILGVLAIILLLIGVQEADLNKVGRRLAWLGFTLALLACFWGLGALATGRSWSVLVGHNGTLSLSHAVTLAWSTLILGAMLVILGLRLGSLDLGSAAVDLEAFDPLNLHVDESLVYVMFAAVGSFAGAKAIAVQRAKTQPEAVARDLLSREAPALVDELRRMEVPEARARALVRSMAEQMGKHNSFASVRAEPERLARDAGLLKGRAARDVVETEARYAQGAADLLYNRSLAEVKRRATPKAPSPTFRDLVSRQGDHGPTLELGKAQWAVISLVAMIAFAFGVWALLGVGCSQGDCFPGLPALPSGVAGMLVASGGGYVGSKIGS